MSCVRPTWCARGWRGRIEPFHGALAAPILDALDAPPARALRGLLAEALTTQSPHRYVRIAVHLQAAARNREAIDYLLMGVERADRALAHPRAARLYGLALSAGLDAEMLGGASSVYAHAQRMTGRGLEAAEAHLEAARNEPETWKNFDLRRRAAQEFLLMRHLEQGRARRASRSIASSRRPGP